MRLRRDARDRRPTVLVLGLRGVPDVQGGVETHAENLYPRLVDLGWYVEVIVRSPFAVPGMRRWRGVSLTSLWSPRLPGVEAFVHSVIGAMYAAVLRPDVLHIHAVGPAIVTPFVRAAGVKVVVTHHGADYERDKWSPFARLILRIGERFGMLYASDRIAISTTIQKLVREKYRRDAHVIPNGVVVRVPSSGKDFLARFGLQRGRYLVQVSRMVPEKRQLDLIQAFSGADLDDWKLVLVGHLDESRYSKEVQRAAASAGVVLTGLLRGAALEEAYSHAGAFVLPSSHEGLPIAMLEAFSFGLPVVASDIPANREAGLDEASYFPVGDVERLRAAIEAVVRAGNSETTRAARIESIKQRYDWHVIAKRTSDVLRQAAMLKTDAEVSDQAHP